jgi:hypothetical protein
MLQFVPMLLEALSQLFRSAIEIQAQRLMTFNQRVSAGWSLVVARIYLFVTVS